LQSYGREGKEAQESPPGGLLLDYLFKTMNVARETKGLPNVSQGLLPQWLRSFGEVLIL